MTQLMVPRADMSEFRKRFRWLVGFVLAAFGLITWKLVRLQVVERDTYRAVARENIIRRVFIPTTRGVIRDVQGKVFASSRPGYNVYAVPGQVLPSARPSRRGLPPVVDVDTWPKIADVLRLNPEERSRYEAKLQAACAESDSDKSPCWRPVLLREDVPRDLIAELEQHEAQLGGLDIVKTQVRYYPFEHTASHALGYVSEIDAETLAKVRPPNFEQLSPSERQGQNPLGYEPGDIVGATGVERAWESYLRGQRGWEKKLVDARGRYRNGPETEHYIDDPKRQEPVAGRDIRLTLDVDLEQAVERAMHAHRTGAVVVVDVASGRLLALYSKPEFDPNDVSGGSGRARIREAFGRLFQDPTHPLLDRTMSGAFQPGSTFKPFSALAALEDKLIPPKDTERCEGVLMFGRRAFHCTHVHGKVNMKEAIAASCNIYFFRLAETVGMDRIARVAMQFGLGQKTGIGVNPEATGRIATRSWYALHYRDQFRIGFTLNAAIGQGATTTTPLQLALAYAALANGGKLYHPQLVSRMETSDGTVAQDFPARLRQQVGIAPANIDFLRDALYAVVNDPKGTAYSVRDSALEVAGKTGTAQTGYNPSKTNDSQNAAYDTRDHAWFAAYYPVKQPEIAVVVLVEHGGSGPTQAAPVAIQIVRDYKRIAAERASGLVHRDAPTARPPKATRGTP